MGVDKVGPGTLVLNNNNTYNGVTTVFDGAIRIQKGGALGGMTAPLRVGAPSGKMQTTSPCLSVSEAAANDRMSDFGPGWRSIGMRYRWAR